MRSILTIVTYLWRDETRDDRGYVCGPEHVVILRNMIERNITVPHQFLCGYGPGFKEEDFGCEAFEMTFEKHVPGTVYARLEQHQVGYFHDGIDRVLSLDVDMVITGNIDHIVGREEDIVLFHNPNFPAPGRAFYQGSIQLFTPGARPELYEDFDPVRQTVQHDDGEYPINWRFGGKEQAWISERLSWDEAYFDESDGIYGAGRLGGNGVYTELPDNACIVTVPGSRAPWQVEVQDKHPWIRDHWR